MQKKYPVRLLDSVLSVCLAIMLISCTVSDDEKIRKNVKAGTSVIDPNILVEVQNGVVNLRGAVKDSTSRSAAENSIKEMKGVRSVINSIEVK